MSSSILQEGMKKTATKALLDASSLMEEKNELFRLYQSIMAEKVLLTVEDASVVDEEDNSIYCCLIEERTLSKTVLVEEIFHKVKEIKPYVTLKYVDHKVETLGLRRVYGVDHPESDVKEDTNPNCLWCWEAIQICHLPEHHRGSMILRRSVRAKIHTRIMALSRTVDALTTCMDPVIISELEDKLSKIPNKAKIGMMYETNKKRMAEKALKQELRKKKLEEESETRALEKESLLSDKERKRLQKELEKKLARFDEKMKKLSEKTTKRRLKLEEELSKLDREAIEEKEGIQKEKEEMRIKLEAENEIKFSKWLKERLTPAAADPVRSTPSTPVQSQDYIDVDKQIMEEETSPIASLPFVSIPRENLLTEVPSPQSSI